MNRPIALCMVVTALACSESPKAEASRAVPADSAAAVVPDTSVADSVMARDTARQLPER